MFKTTATILRGRGSSWVFLIGTSTNDRDFSAIVSSAAPKKVYLFRHTSKTQGIGVGDR